MNIAQLVAIRLKSKIGPAILANESLRSGSALVVVLAFLLLFVGLVLFFLSRVLLSRQLSDSSFNETKAQLIAQSGLDVIIGDLKQELYTNSTKVQLVNLLSTKTNFVYEPKYVVGVPAGTNMMPFVNGTASIPNLIRNSMRTNTAAMTYAGVVTRASAVNSTDISANGRAVSLGRWNAHYLVPQQTPGSQDPTPTTAFAPYAPDWVIVTRSGPQKYANWIATLKDSSAANVNFAIGRYAFAIYDEGGLVDANVAGFPSTLSLSQAAEKGSLAFADLSQLSLATTNIDNLVGWRNHATTQPTGSLSSGYIFSASSTTNYLGYIAPASGSPPTFLTTHTLSATGQTDQAFNSRQDLIRYQRATGMSPGALQYLGTFTRELNRPCYSPRVTIDPTFGGGTPAVTNYPGTINPLVQEVLSTSTGDPLVSQRFPLSRLGLFTNSTVNSALISTYFGLTKIDSHTWTYTHLTSNKISTLNQVSTKSRSPDFFELLQAAILNGSLFYPARFNLSSTYNTYSWAIPPTSSTTAPDPTVIIQIGANLINQYQPNNFPMTVQVPISTPPQLVSGIDDLPYFSEMFLFAYRPDLSDSYRAELDTYLSFEFWNPHQNTSAVSGPTQVRMVLTPPSTGVSVSILKYDTTPVNPQPEQEIASSSYLIPPTSSSTYQVLFTNSSAFREPTILTPPNVIATGPNGTDKTSPEWTAITANNAGFLCGQYTNSGVIPDHDYAVSKGLTPVNSFRYHRPALHSSSSAGNMSFELDYWDPTANAWFPYQGEPQVASTTSLSATTYEGEIQDVDYGTSLNGGAALSASASTNYTSALYYANRSFQLVDPRYTHLLIGDSTPNGSVRPFGVNGMQGYYYAPTGPQFYAKPYAAGGDLTGAGMYPASYNENINSLTCYLTDADGVSRPSDGYLGSTPYLSSAAAGSAYGRPIILHRPFRSVAEMGFACRSPGYWKTINFFSPNSADVGLLDYFSLEDAPMVAGKINLNTRQTVSLQAALSGAYREESSSSYVPAGGAVALANAIVTHTATAPLLSKADLVRGLLADSTVTGAIDSMEGAGNKTVKGRREAMVRALADVGTTRSWNLLIDIIAQSGRYAPTSASLSQFTVQGEKHYWLHVAIDRYTGQIIDQQLEDVDE